MCFVRAGRSTADLTDQSELVQNQQTRSMIAYLMAHRAVHLKSEANGWLDFGVRALRDSC